MKTYQKIGLLLLTGGILSGCEPKTTEDYTTIWNQRIESGETIGDTVRYLETLNGKQKDYEITINGSDHIKRQFSRLDGNFKITTWDPNGDIYTYHSSYSTYVNPEKNILIVKQPANNGVYNKGVSLFWQYFNKISKEIYDKNNENKKLKEARQLKEQKLREEKQSKLEQKLEVPTR